jgi:hypothetical protein
MVAAIGAFDGEPFPVIPSGLPQRCTPDAADGTTLFFMDGDARSRSVMGGKPEKYAQFEVYRP